MTKLGKLFMGNLPVGKDLKLLLIIGGLYALSVALSNTFVNIYIWKQNQDYLTVALYNLATVVVQPLVFILAGRWAKQVDRVLVLRWGVFFLSLFYLVVLLMGDMAATYVLILGILLGIGFGFYWLAFNVLTFEITEPDTRDIFNGLLGLLGSLAGMTGPFFAGWVITRMNNTSGYTFIFSLSLALFIVAVILSFLLKRRSVEGDFKLKQVLRWGELSENWRSILLANFAQGVREGSFAFLIFVWVFIAAGTELALGTYSLITSAISFVLYYVVGRFIPTRYRPVMMLVGALLLSASVFFIAFEFTFTRLIIFGVLVAIAYPMIMVPLISLTYDVIGQAKHAAQWRIEYVVGRELFLNGGRVVSILLFLAVLGLFNDEQGLPYFIMLVGQAQLFVYYFIRHVHLKETNRIKKRAS